MRAFGFTNNYYYYFHYLLWFCLFWNAIHDFSLLHVLSAPPCIACLLKSQTFRFAHIEREGGMQDADGLLNPIERLAAAAATFYTFVVRANAI